MYNRRVWLNKAESSFSGNMVAFADDIKCDKGIYNEMFLRISDCHHTVNLHRSTDDAVDDFINKMKILRDELNLFIEYLETDVLETKNESRTDAVHVLINNQPVWLDLGNLRDDELAMRNDKGDYETESGEQHFTWNNAIKAAEKQGKRLLACEEYKFIASLPNSWDNEKKGLWFTFNRVEGGYVEVFFPAAGFRNSTTDALTNSGANGGYWSATGTGTFAYYLYFVSGNINPSCYNYRADGFSVRCVRDI